MNDLPAFSFDNSYAARLEGFYVPWKGAVARAPHVVRLNLGLAEELGLDPDALADEGGARVLSGSVSPAGAEPLAMAYAGHQFGAFSPQLGDGRALLLGEVIDRHGNRRDIHLKGSGRTPFSRGGDGKAALGPVLREYLIGEAMHGLGIPTTRALAAVTTGEEIARDGLLPGAVLARVAASHLRVGTFEYFAARGEGGKLRLLADYAIDRHHPDLAGQPDRYLGLLARVCAAQAALIARWMLVGFVHGVMNTDNMTISGETIDYGPCAFIDVYDPAAVFSSIDERGRYAYGNQPMAAQWNLARLAEALLDLIRPGDAAEAVRMATGAVAAFPDLYRQHWLAGMRKKLGLFREDAGDFGLATGLLSATEGQGVDFTQLFRALADAAEGGDSPVRALFADPAAADDWLGQWHRRLASDGAAPEDRAAAMNRVNPVYIARNHQVEKALSAAASGDMAPFDRLVALLARPFESVAGAEAYESPAPESFGRYRTFCGT